MEGGVGKEGGEGQGWREGEEGGVEGRGRREGWKGGAGGRGEREGREGGVRVHACMHACSHLHIQTIQDCVVRERASQHKAALTVIGTEC